MDVLDISDLRFPGGTSHSIAEEVRAQRRHGWTTGLVHLNGPLVTRVTPVNPQIRRLVDGRQVKLLVGDDPVEADVVVVRHPAVLQHAAEQLPPVRTGSVVVVANAGPRDIDGYEHYRPETVHQIAAEHFGVEPVWAPIGPLVRDEIAPLLDPGSLRAEDWVNIIEVDAWQVRRSGWQSDRPVIGRHSRSSPQKWPADAATLRLVYPTDGSMTVKVLGGAGPAEKLLGERPPSWEVLEFGEQAPRDFLAGLDFFVYHHDPRWVEAFGRTILEALASGVPAVLPPHFEALFGPAASYAEPSGVRDLITGLYADRARYEAQVAAATADVRRRFGHEAHVGRITDLIGAPRTAGPDQPGTAVPVAPPATAGAGALPTVPSAGPVAVEKPRLLFITSNGAGMGHLTRLLAYARRTAADAEPHFLSLSQAVGVVGEFGFGYEYLPSTKATGMSAKTWHALFAERVSETVARLRPAAVVFDGTWPYDGIVAARRADPGPRWVWSRRGMWRAGQNREQLAKAAWFDAVLEPGDFAAAYDQGVTVAAPSRRVGPVTLADHDELEDRATARRSLGLDPDAPMALVSLGAGNIDDTSGTTGAVVGALRRLGVEICVTRPAISARGGGLDDVHLIRDFPLSRRYRAFDLAVSATGYNSFHELLRFGLPTLFVPNRATSLDDQAGRARFAADRGLAHALDDVTVETAQPLLADLLERGPTMVAAMADLDPGNGAHEGAALLLDLAAGRPSW
ncbi:hypothetical protein [Friedmanniella luteola]|uniref:hypothetical protein n=1 Tax=Friedmanniella luteola TaxID=546871 RepID=UPI0018D3057C|nr:hypothetical protein [Friedmanniella luteola]